MKFFSPIALVALFVFIGLSPLDAQIEIREVAGKSTPKANRERGFEILEGIKKALETHYYDKNYRGLDIDKKFKEAEEQIKTLETNAHIFRVIAGLLLAFNDSHTRFYPPGRTNRVEYGFSMQMIGATGVIVDVKKDSDAEKKGLRMGDVMLRIGQYPVNRDTLWVLNYFIYQLEPMVNLPIVVADGKGGERSLVIEASIKTLEERLKEDEKRRREKQENPYKCAQLSTEIIACKLRTFSVERKYIDKMMKEASAGSKLILDLRGNRGGLLKIEEYLTGHFFGHEVKIADMIWRKKKEERFAKSVGDRQFKGELVVLIDSNSASASEMFSRVIQLERRGKIVGDISAGAVMTSYNLPMAAWRGSSTASLYGMNVTVADVIMSDGNRLEHVGVIPDHRVGPSAAALLQKNDPVLAYAAGLLGTKLTPEDAGRLGFLFKPPEDEDEEKQDDGKEP